MNTGHAGQCAFVRTSACARAWQRYWPEVPDMCTPSPQKREEKRPHARRAFAPTRPAPARPA